MANFGTQPKLGKWCPGSSLSRVRKSLAVRLLLSAVVTASAIACAGRSSSRPAGVVQDGRSTRFTADETMRMLAVLGRCDRSLIEGVGSAWTPTEQQRVSVDRLVRREISRIELDSSLHPNGYYLQFFGIYRHREPMIFVNAFHEILLPHPTSGTQPLGEWSSEAIVVCDGGKGTFQALYDPDRRKFTLLRFGARFGPP